jgi:hypothetical protein
MPIVELWIYASDAVASAHLLLAHDRLSDLLASSSPLEVC